MDAELLRIIRNNIEKYPLMRIQDVYKLVYQHEFGCAHAVTDPESAREWLHREYRAVRQEDAPLYEDVGGGYVRVNLSALDANGVSPDELLEWFVKSAGPAGDKEEFARILRELPNLCSCFDSGEMTAFFEEMAAKYFPSVHHSEAFREAYHPAYRVVKLDLVRGD